MKTLEETFDIEKIREIVPVVSIDEFYEDCKDEIQPEIRWTPFKLIQNKSMSNLARFLTMKKTMIEIRGRFPVKNRVTEEQKSDKDANAKFVKETWKTRCLAFNFDEDI